MNKFWMFMAIAVIPFNTATPLNEKLIDEVSQNTDDDWDDVDASNSEEEWSFVEKGSNLSHQTDEQFQLYHGQTHFAVSMLKSLHKAAPNKNHFFSPHSTYRALILAFIGAEGTTRKSLSRALFLNWAHNKSQVVAAYEMEVKARAMRSFGESIQFNSADRLYVSDKVDLNTNIVSLFSTSIEKVDFTDAETRREEINAFVEKVTQSHIKDLLAPGTISAATNLVLTNAAFFKGFWATKFDKNRTTMKAFNGGCKKNVEMMQTEGNFKYGVINELNVAFLELPYSGEDVAISMYVYLPIENTPTAVDDLLKEFTTKTVNEALAAGKVQLVDVEFPKISLDGSYVLANVLEDMGVKNLFGPSADLSGFSTTTNLHFDDAIHKAKIEIDEDGSTAAAAVATFRRSLKFDEDEPVKFHCDHSFVFIINDRITSEILFASIYRGLN